MIIPSIDLMSGKAVKLVNGNPNKKEFERDALALAKEFSIYPEINLIDLDAAFSKGSNLGLIKKICGICRCNVGGGIRDVKYAYELLKSGAENLIIGTKAEKDFLSKLPKERIVVALDSKKGKVVDSGWVNYTGKSPIQKAAETEEYCSGFLYTFVDNEGTMSGIDLETIKEIRNITGKKIMYAGGISGSTDILELQKSGADAVIGMAYYSGRIKLNSLVPELLDFKKGNGMIPTIVRDEAGNILMLAYSTKESLEKAIELKKGIYFSRSRKELWEKGSTSGNTQELVRFEADCDMDSMIFTVRQKNIACHNGRYSCFTDTGFRLDNLLRIIEGKRGSGSFTANIMDDEAMLRKKIVEEAQEVVNYRDAENLRWEIADLLYFVGILMVKKDICLRDVENELGTRDSMKKLIKTTKLI